MRVSLVRAEPWAPAFEWETEDARTAEFDHYLTVDSASPGYQEVGLMAVGNLHRLSGLKLARNRLVEVKRGAFCGKDRYISQHVGPGGEVLNRQSEIPTLAPLQHCLEGHAHVSQGDPRARLPPIPYSPEEAENRGRCGYRGRDYRPLHEQLERLLLLPGRHPHCLNHSPCWPTLGLLQRDEPARPRVARYLPYFHLCHGRVLPFRSNMIVLLGALYH